MLFKNRPQATYYGRRQFAFYPFLLQVTLVFGDSMTKFQPISYKLNMCPKHPTTHLRIRKRVNLTDSQHVWRLVRIWVRFSTNPEPMRILEPFSFADKPIFNVRHTSHMGVWLISVQQSAKDVSVTPNWSWPVCFDFKPKRDLSHRN